MILCRVISLSGEFSLLFTKANFYHVLLVLLKKEVVLTMLKLLIDNMLE